jgi:cytochrome c oxidase cbb3-type subunit 4
MDVNTLRGLVLLLLVIAFAGLYWWTWSGRRDRFDDAANAPFADEDDEAERARRRAAGDDAGSERSGSAPQQASHREN